MKIKKIVAAMVLVGVLTGGMYHSYNLIQNNTSSRIIKPGVVYAADNKVVVDDELKNMAIEEIRKYFGEAPDFKKLSFKTSTESVEQQIKEIDDAIDYAKAIKNKTKADEQFIQDLEADKKDIKVGKATMVWLGNNNEIYSVSFNDKTKEILSAVYRVKPDLNQVKTENFINLEQATTIAKEFILKNNLDDIKNVKLIGKSEYETYYNDSYNGPDTFFLLFQDASDASKKANLEIDKATGKVTYFSVGAGAEAEYTKNNVSK